MDYLGIMDWQQSVTLGIVGITASAFLYPRLKPKSRAFDFKRDTHCGCSQGADEPQKSSIVFRAQKGKPRQVILKVR